VEPEIAEKIDIGEKMANEHEEADGFDDFVEPEVREKGNIEEQVAQDEEEDDFDNFEQADIKLNNQGEDVQESNPISDDEDEKEIDLEEDVYDYDEEDNLEAVDLPENPNLETEAIKFAWYLFKQCPNVEVLQRSLVTTLLLSKEMSRKYYQEFRGKSGNLIVLQRKS
jgi:hypothetical protein